jgi:hypothetical protein
MPIQEKGQLICLSMGSRVKWVEISQDYKNYLALILETGLKGS